MSEVYADGLVRLHHGDALEELRVFEACSVQCVVTSPPFWGLRDYGVEGQIGLEGTPDKYVSRLVEVFREVWRVLRGDGTVWVNLGDSYATGAGKVGACPGGGAQGAAWTGPTTQPNRMRVAGFRPGNGEAAGSALGGGKKGVSNRNGAPCPPDLKPKDLVGIPWRVAFALQAGGWYLRSDIVWAKPNPMPESVVDRPTKAHEYMFLLSKSERYFWDQEAVRERCALSTEADARQQDPAYVEIRIRNRGGRTDGFTSGSGLLKAREAGRNLRSVWTITTQPYPEAHFATFPEDLVVPCVKAGTSEYGACAGCGAPWARVVKRESGVAEAYQRPKHMQSAHSTLSLGGNGSHEWAMRGSHVTTTGWAATCACGRAEVVPCVVLDPFCGSGTAVYVAKELGRRGIGIDLNAQYLALAADRLRQGVLDFTGASTSPPSRAVEQVALL